MWHRITEGQRRRERCWRPGKPLQEESADMRASLLSVP